GQHNFYRFSAKQGQVFDVRCYARRLGSPLDAVVDIYNHERKHLVGNDDSGGPDSYLRFTAPADGDYFLVVRDQLLRGGPTFNYRVEVSPVRPNLTVTIPKVQQFSQDRQTIIVARGNRYASRVGVDRQDVGGDVTIRAEDLPPGVTASEVSIGGSQTAGPMLFEAAADAPIGGALSTLSGKFTDPNQSLLGKYRQRFELVIAE